jgi:hypothetical protein
LLSIVGLVVFTGLLLAGESQDVFLVRKTQRYQVIRKPLNFMKENFICSLIMIMKGSG